LLPQQFDSQLHFLKLIQRIFIILIISTLTNISVLAQDVFFSQPYTVPLLLNPAYTGMQGATRAGGIYRNQWASVADPYVSYGVFADYYFEDYKSGIGITALSDRQAGGLLVKNQVGFSYAYHLQLAEKMAVNFGLQPQLTFTSISDAELVFPDMINNNGHVTDGGYSSASNVHFDMALGGVFSYDFLYAGLSLQHLLAPAEYAVGEVDVAIPRRYALHAGANFYLDIQNKFSRNVSAYRNVATASLLLSPNVLFTAQGGSSLLQAGCFVGLQGFSLGFFYKHGLGATANFYMACAAYSSELFSISYSFDFGAISQDVKTFSANTHELSLSFRIRRTKPRRGYNFSYQTLEEPRNAPDV
jgi:type IX secretion system PorP/SprF family membrane protein